LEGWPKAPFEARPIADIIGEEQRAARALRVKQQADTRVAERDAAAETAVLAQEDLGRSRAEESQLVELAKQNAIGLATTNLRLLRGANKLAERIELALADEKMSTNEYAILLQRIATITAKSNESARLAIQLERLVLGEAETIVGVQLQDVSLEEADAIVQRAAAAVARAKAAGVLH
jgi:hypothetical protein